MKILLIMPDAHMHKLRIGSFVRSMREAPLTLTTLAALVPTASDVQIEIVDGSVDKIPLTAAADLVGISAITGCAPAAYRLADHYRARGIPVVLGGVHVSILPGEAAPHADSLVIGRGEAAWPRLLADFRLGKLKPFYREAELPDDVLADVPVPRRDLQRRSAYMVPDTVQATRGCKRTCDFCSVPVIWPRFLKRPVADVIRDVRAAPGRIIAFNDVSLLEDLDYAKELFTALIPLKKTWGGLVTTDVVNDPALIELMARSGCSYLLLGFETLNQASLSQIYKGFNKAHPYRDVIAQLHAHNISVQGCLVFGFDQDDATVFRTTVEMVQELKLDIPRYSLYTPYPGTLLFKRLQKEGRIISYNWNDYDTMHVVIRPAQMTPEELFAGFKWAYRETFRLRRIVPRVAQPRINAAINFVGNLAYRIFIRRLYREPRFATPYSVGDPGTPPPQEFWQAEWLAAQIGDVRSEAGP
ncbi:MAG: radical SAM protein [Kiritimatiellaeota bacterium]|nr:radical SAM protein [Kiritimatiellota bacterium]